MTVTNADIDRRLSALEQDMALVKQEQSHQRELYGAHFKTLELGIERLAAKFDAFSVRYDTEHADPKQSAAGRVLLDRIDRIEEMQGEHGQTIEDVRATGKALRWVIGGNVLTAIAAGAAILKAIGAF